MNDAPALTPGAPPDSRPAPVPTRTNGGIVSRLMDGILVAAVAGSVFLSGASFLRGRAPARASSDGSVAQLEARLGGSTLGPTPVVSAKDGSMRIYDHGAGPALLLFFRSTCPACERNAPQWQALMRSVPVGVRKVGFAVEELGSALDWARRHRLALDDILILQRPDDWAIPAVPATLLVGKDGKVREVKIGVLDSTALGLLSKRVQR